jgi:alginate O-acetyltransferase complex protein AlgI
MTFHSVEFFVYLFAGLVLFHACPVRCRPGLLLVYSYLFYCTWSVWYAVLLLAASLWTFGLALLIHRLPVGRKRTGVFALGVAGALGLLIFFKYLQPLHFYLFPSSDTGEPLRASSLLIPLGISFYTFKIISYLADVYLEKFPPEANLVILCAHIAFFPQILSGPIQRSQDFSDQLRSQQQPNGSLFLDGMVLIALGFLKKLLADQLAIPINEIFNSPRAFHGLPCLLACYLFPVQLYFDFSGYTDVAIGIGRLFGLESPCNFRAPFLATNIQEFWKRWHITLTTWLRDYVFSPLSLCLRDWGLVGLFLSICINMILIGLWHAATLPYLLFGLLHALFLCVYVFSGGLRRRMGRGVTGTVMSWAITMTLVAVAFVFFRAPSAKHALVLLRHSFSFSLHSGPFTKPVVLCALAAVVICQLLEIGRMRLPRSEVIRYGLITATLLLVYFYAPFATVSFLYQRY